jgi:cytidylate kinase
MEADLYQRLMEAPSLMQRLTREHSRYLIYIQCSLVEAAKQDNLVYHGYAGQLFLRGIRHAVKIRLEAPWEQRVEALATASDMTADEARDFISKADEERMRWVRFMYGLEWHDPSLYDLSLNLKQMSVDTVCDIVECIVRSDAYRTTEESLVALNNLSLSCEVRAAIAADDRLWSQPVQVSAKGPAVTLRGSVKSAKVRDALLDLASRVKGVVKVHDRLTLPAERLHGGIYGHD